MDKKKADNHQIILIKNTEFENLLKRIAKEKDEEEQRIKRYEEKKEEKKLKDRRRCDLVRAIYSVYRFAVNKLEMRPGPLSVKEFEAAEAELRKLAESNVKKWSVFRFLGKKTIWHFYLERGCFPFNSRLFGTRVYWCMEPSEEPEESDFEEWSASLDDNTDYIPSNSRRLCEALLKKRGLK